MRKVGRDGLNVPTFANLANQRRIIRILKLIVTPVLGFLLQWHCCKRASWRFSNSSVVTDFISKEPFHISSPMRHLVNTNSTLSSLNTNQIHIQFIILHKMRHPFNKNKIWQFTNEDRKREIIVDFFTSLKWLRMGDIGCMTTSSCPLSYVY